MSVTLLHENMIGVNKLNLALHNSYHFFAEIPIDT